MIIGIDASRAAIEKQTGTEAYAYQLIRALVPKANARGHHVKLYYNQEASRPITYAPHQTVHIPLPRLWTHVRLAAELQQEPPDVFFTPAHVIPATYFGASVATIHDVGYVHFPEMHTKMQLRQLEGGTRQNAERSRFVIADSHATKDDVVSHYGVSPQKVEVVYPGRNPALKAVTDEATLAATREKYKLASPYLLTLGTIQPRKNIGRIVQAFAQVASQIPHQLVLAGSGGWLSAPIFRAIDALPAAVRERVVITGFVDDADKAALISGASALVFPSLYEGFGFPVLEAQACGVPVLAANTSSLPEVAGDGALLVKPTDTESIAAGILQLVSEEALRSYVIEKGEANLARFSWLDSAEKVLDVLEKAAA